MGAMEVETNFLRLLKPVALGDRIDGWRVCWIGGWDKCRVLVVVMVERPRRTRRSARRAANTSSFVSDHKERPNRRTTKAVGAGMLTAHVPERD